MSNQLSKSFPQTPTRKSHKEIYAQFFESPSRESFRDLLREQIGESVNYDFKESWPDATGLAKHVLGMGNLDGGVVVTGVAEREDKSLKAVGLNSLRDKADIINGIQSFLPKSLLHLVEILDFHFEASEYPQIQGKLFQVLIVGSNPKDLPYISMRSGTNIRENTINPLHNSW